MLLACAVAARADDPFVGTVTDPRTGERQAVSANHMREAIDRMNRAAGYQKWQAIPAGG